MLLGSSHHHPPPGCSTFLNWNAVPTKHSLPYLPLYFLTLWVCLFQAPQVRGIKQYRLHLTYRCCCWLVAQSCPTLCDPTRCSLPGSSVHGVLQARTLEWVAISLSRGSSRPRDWTCISCNDRWILYQWATWEARTSYTVECIFKVERRGF